MKKLNNKGFSLIELLGVMVILSLILVAGVAQYRKYIKQVSDEVYDDMAQSIYAATENYLMDHPNAKKVEVSDLIEEGYIEDIADPGKADSNCESKVTITPSTESSDDTALNKNSYVVNLCCNKYDYSYRYPENIKSKDKFCKVYPYDIKKIKDVKVLNVYPTPSFANNVMNWMDTYGKGIIHVTPVYINDFNNDPEYYMKNEKDEWKYDVVVFGFADSNGGKDLSKKSRDATEKYMISGGSVIFGHDTIYSSTAHPYFNTLDKYINIENYSPWSWTGRTQVKIQKTGIFTTYPYNIGDEGTILTIPTSHTSGQRAHGDVWLTFEGLTNPDESVYLTTYGNNAFIQIGHSNGAATPDEQKILTNIIFYTLAKQYTDDEDDE